MRLPLGAIAVAHLAVVVAIIGTVAAVAVSRLLVLPDPVNGPVRVLTEAKP
ncbi:hypothetical protein [Methylobacterium sp. JK268]